MALYLHGPACYDAVAIIAKTTADEMAQPDAFRAELLEGGFFISPSPNARHHRVGRSFLTRLDAFVRRGKLGVIFVSLFDAVLSRRRWKPGRPAVIPRMLCIASLLGTASCEDAGQEKATLKPAALQVKAQSQSTKLGELPQINLVQRAGLNEAEAKRLRAHIASLARLERPYFGVSPTLSGGAFSPVPELHEINSMLLTDHHIEVAEALRAIVAMGPPALPSLLDALEDTTPTKLQITHDGNFGVMEFQRELWGNVLNPCEKEALRSTLDKHGRIRDLEGEGHISSYTVTVGDACFVAIGQIVGRPYNAVRYQPTACVYINSPTHDPELRRLVRMMWSSEDSSARVLESLKHDYATQGISDGESLDWMSAADMFQTGAALRLLYYFPGESKGLICSRLDGLDVHDTSGNLDAFTKREVTNGVRTEDFIKAIAWCKEKEIVSALGRIVERSDDTEILRHIRRE